MLALSALRIFNLFTALPYARRHVPMCCTGTSLCIAALDLINEDDGDDDDDVAALDLINEDDGDDDDDASDYYTITTYCQDGLRINGSCQSCGAPERASCVCLFQDLRHYVSTLEAPDELV
jgi:hypothetical protein